MEMQGLILELQPLWKKNYYKHSEMTEEESMELSEYLKELKKCEFNHDLKDYFMVESDVGELICKIQPIWNKFNMGCDETQITEEEAIHMTVLLKEYIDRGGDTAYFTQGAGAPGECILC